MLHALFSDHAVIQQGAPVRIFGSGAAYGETVLVALAGYEASGIAGCEGTWEAELPALRSGGPHRLVVSCGGSCLVRNNILIGEVWLCSGQSNMQFSMREWEERNGSLIPDPLFSSVRYFSVGEASALDPCGNLAGAWQQCHGDAAAGCSAIAMFFARRIRDELGVPVGLIVNALGDTEIATWMPRSSLEKRDSHRHIRGRIPTHLPGSIRPRAYEDDPQHNGLCAQPDLDDSHWRTMSLPGVWQFQGHPHSGSVWFRREVEIPPEWVGRELVLEPGILDDFDTTYFNGVEVGRTGPETPDSYAKPRRYYVQAKHVRAGRAVLALRIFDACSLGGVGGQAGQMRVFPADDPARALFLGGQWKFQPDRVLPWLWSQSPPPTLLFNAMVYPLVKFRIRGALWYQGESDRIRASLYKDLLADLVAAWRELWGYEFPFYIVQLPNFMSRQPDPCESLWAEIREAQRLAAEEIPTCAQAVAIDVGEADNIHPKNKQAVGERLAALALAKTYGRSIPCCGPGYSGFRIEGNCIRIFFSQASRLSSRGALRGFAIAGKDRVFRWGKAQIEGGTIVVFHPDIPAPCAVRYAWQDNPPSPLENSDGFPASPFRTDDWPLISENFRI